MHWWHIRKMDDTFRSIQSIRKIAYVCVSFGTQATYSRLTWQTVQLCTAEYLLFVCAWNFFTRNWVTKKHKCTARIAMDLENCASTANDMNWQVVKNMNLSQLNFYFYLYLPIENYFRWFFTIQFCVAFWGKAQNGNRKVSSLAIFMNDSS